MPASPDLDLAARLAVASLAGLAVGVEREWSGHAHGPRARFAGVRTFFLLGLLGGLAGWMGATGLVPLGVAVLLGAGALTVAAYAVASRQGGEEAVDATTETAALVVVALGATAGLGYLAPVLGAAAVIALALREKRAIRAAIERIDEKELRAALQFAVISLALLPILPEGPYGPFDAIRPRSLWTVVLLFSGISFAGYLARRFLGQTRGYPVAGLLGGIVSSTAVTLTFSRQSRETKDAGPALALGVVAACTVLFPRVLIVSGLLNPAVARALLPFLAPPLVVGLAFVARAWWKPQKAAEEVLEQGSPLALLSAIRMAVLFQVVLLAVDVMRREFGTRGLLATAAALGLTDVDALTLSMARYGETPSAVPLAALAIAVSILSNTTVKLVMALSIGRGPFRPRAAAGLLALAAAGGAGIWMGTQLPW